MHVTHKVHSADFIEINQTKRNSCLQFWYILSQCIIYACIINDRYNVDFIEINQIKSNKQSCLRRCGQRLNFRLL